MIHKNDNDCKFVYCLYFFRSPCVSMLGFNLLSYIVSVEVIAFEMKISALIVPEPKKSGN